VENVNARRIYRKKGHDQRGEQHGTAAPWKGRPLAAA
jgi:hypothetical protein